MTGKKIAMLGVVGLLLFFVFTEPALAATATNSALAGLKDGAEAVITFGRNLFK